MYSKEDIELKFYTLENHNSNTSIIHDSEIFEYSTIIESYVTRGKLKEALEYLKYDISYSLVLKRPSLGIEAKRTAILSKCSAAFLTLENLKSNKPFHSLGYNLLMRYLEELAIHIMKSNPQIDYVPSEWVTYYSKEQLGSRSRRLSTSAGVTNFCFIKTEPNKIANLICQQQHDKYSFLGLLYALSFTKKMKVGNFKELLFTTAERCDFTPNATKDYIKRNFNPTKDIEKIKDFLDVLRHTFPDKEKSILQECFRPQNIISKRLANYILKVLDDFPIRIEYNMSSIIGLCFNVVEMDNIYYHKEIGYLTNQIEIFLTK